ncbi:hypothetical protein FisN_30Lh032 [Fistulifera solaris]|uniref:RING-type domain-containing protein n=1 Tax=Fistulifera solaris TaxID=1519565 RepID=A0A1Z5JII5_FISSO|nr:hypothetical protein FisN_30Lh032 [Fistulifera solaris]|eukprot:GAX13746.1 hypothetical protein FisN_30Lh032 [Fistulifera solaris]
MDTPSKMAAETAKRIPFHCLICFEAFHLKDRPPMVLPCGHTFVCLPCTKRIDKCMECRESLYLSSHSIPSSRAVHALMSPQSPVRSHAPPTSTTPLPIPKNLVLMSLMEVAECQSRPSAGDNAAMEDDEEMYESHPMIHGTTALSSSCGTYLVKEPLTVVSWDPRNTEGEMKNREVDSTVLMKRQKIQVVDFENGIARLARNAGFVKANKSQLVKVGTPVDEACRLEGLLKTVRNRSADLQRELEANRKLETNLSRQLEAALETAAPNFMEPVSFESYPTTPEQHIVKPTFQTPQSSPGSSATNSFEDTPTRQASPDYQKGENEQNYRQLFYYTGSECDENMNNRTEQMHSLPRMPTHTSSFDGIDFRTGLSGHRVLSVGKSGGSHTPRVRMRMMMSQHRGIPNSRPYRRSSNPPPSSVTDPSMKE